MKSLQNKNASIWTNVPYFVNSFRGCMDSLRDLQSRNVSDEGSWCVSFCFTASTQFVHLCAQLVQLLHL